MEAQGHDNPLCTEVTYVDVEDIVNTEAFRAAVNAAVHMREQELQIREVELLIREEEHAALMAALSTLYNMYTPQHTYRVL